MLQNRDRRGLQDVEGNGAESAQANHRVSPGEVVDSDETISEDTSQANEEDIYRGMPLLVTPGRNVKAARQATLR
jgi:hypothetical protein